MRNVMHKIRWKFGFDSYNLSTMRNGGGRGGGERERERERERDAHTKIDIERERERRTPTKIDIEKQIKSIKNLQQLKISRGCDLLEMSLTISFPCLPLVFLFARTAFVPNVSSFVATCLFYSLFARTALFPTFHCLQSNLVILLSCNLCPLQPLFYFLPNVSLFAEQLLFPPTFVLLSSLHESRCFCCHDCQNRNCSLVSSRVHVLDVVVVLS